jgi:enoyl-CoA hydratase/carnithine racemase
MTDAGVRVDCDGPVATVTLCRPHVLNAQTPAMWEALRAIGTDLPGDIRVAVVRGEGRAFSAGLDLTAVSASGGSGSEASAEGSAGDGSADDSSFARMATLSDDEASARIAGYQEAFGWLRRPDIISIAAVHGHAIGAGFQLALACDLRILTEDAKFTMAEVALGLVPDLGGTKRLVELVGYARALDICVTGRRIASAEAERMGLANAVVAADGLDEAVTTLTGQILAAKRDAVVEIKALLLEAAGRTFAAQEVAEREAQIRRIRDVMGAGE